DTRRRTKIVATIGPATRSVETMTDLIRAGADVLRLNFSHGTKEEHAENVAMARAAAELAGREVGLLGDLPGPKLRIDEVEGGVVDLKDGSELVLTTGEGVGAPDHLGVSWEDLQPVERRVRVAGADIPLVAKIEKPQAAENAEAIIRAALGGIMVARGDLGIELPIERVPIVQKRLLELAGRHSRPSITATQM